MPIEVSFADLTITNVAAPSVVAAGSSFPVDVTVFAPKEDFEDGVSYRLVVFVETLGGNPPATSVILQKGNVQDGFWSAPTSTISVTVSAGSGFALYQIRAALLEGPKGLPEPDDPPSIASAANVTLVV